MRISALSRALAVFSDFRGRKRISRHRYEGFRGLARICARPARPAQDKAEMWNIHISDKVVAPNTRRTMTRGHGTM
jgi:hypothetical protein